MKNPLKAFLKKGVSGSGEQANKLERDPYLEAILEATGAGTWEWEVQGNTTRFDQRWFSIIGYTEAEMSPVSVETWRNNLHPDDVSVCEDLLRRHFAGELNYYEVEFRMRHKAGHWVWILARGKVVEWDADGKPYLMRGTHADITERKESEKLVVRQQALQAIVAHISSAFISASQKNFDERVFSALEKLGNFFWADRAYMFLFRKDEDGKLLMSNTHEWCAAGIKPQKEILQNTPVDSLPWWFALITKEHMVIIPEVDALPPEAAAEKAEFSRQGIRSLMALPIVLDSEIAGFYGFDHVRRKGEWSQQDIHLLQVVANSITDLLIRVKFERELIAAKEQAEAASTAKSDFVANMSHEIRTPLNGVIGFLDLMAETKLDQKQQQLMEGSRVSANVLLGIVNDILDFSKIEAGRLDLDPVDTDLNAVAREVVSLFTMQAEDKGLKLELVQATPPIPKVRIDALRVRQVLLNLLSNAVKFTQRGQVKLMPEWQSNADGSVSLKFHVMDTGMGISPHKAQLLFRPFCQGDTSMTRRFGGTGLGLAISKLLAEKLGGDLTFESKENEGSTFCFAANAPLANNDAGKNAMHQPTTIDRNNPSKSADSRQLTVLVADDVRLNNLLIRKIVERMLPGVRVIEATNGREAVELYKSKSPDLIFMDVQMPEMDGLLATQTIRTDCGEKGATVPIIALTAGAFVEERKRCLDGGMDAFLAKPIQRLEVEKLIDTLLLGDRRHGAVQS